MSGDRLLSELAGQAANEDAGALKIIVTENGAAAGMVADLLKKIHRIPKDNIIELGPACNDEQIDRLLAMARPIVLVPKAIVNGRRCIFRLPAGSRRVIALQVLDGEVATFPATHEGSTIQFPPDWFC